MQHVGAHTFKHVHNLHICICVYIRITHTYVNISDVFWKPNKHRFAAQINIVLLHILFVSFTFFSYCFLMNFRTKHLVTFYALKAPLKEQRTRSSYRHLFILNILLSQHQFPFILHWYFCNFCLFFIKITLFTLFFLFSESAICISTDLELVNCYEILLPKLRYYLLFVDVSFTNLDIYVEFIYEKKIFSANSF